MLSGGSHRLGVVGVRGLEKFRYLIGHRYQVMDVHRDLSPMGDR
jgi:hypothetical protein